MGVHHDEGVANRIDPESCADAREGIGEALTGERIGQPLSRESTLILGADAPAVSSLGGLRTPAPGVCRATITGPASANLHTTGLMHRNKEHL